MNTFIVEWFLFQWCFPRVSMNKFLGKIDMSTRDKLTILVLRMAYFERNKSISWLMMPWLLMSPGHQQPRYWLSMINGSLSSMRKAFNSCITSMVRTDRKCKYILIFLQTNFAHKGSILQCNCISSYLISKVFPMSSIQQVQVIHTAYQVTQWLRSVYQEFLKSWDRTWNINQTLNC